MAWFRSGCLAALALVTVSTPARAKGITYDCDTGADHFSELVLPAGDGPFVVSGSVRSRALAESAAYVPLARVQVASASAPDKSPERYAGFALTVLRGEFAKTVSNAAAVQLLNYSVNGGKEEVLPQSLTTPGTVQTFSLSYDGAAVLVKLGTESRSIPLRTGDPVIRLVCSTGEFLFTDLTIAPGR